MKFWKILRNLIDETLPDWQDKFLLYKDLKKQLNLIYPKVSNKRNNSFKHNDERPKKRPRLSDDDVKKAGSKKAKDDFLKFLASETHKFNDFFMDKEEDYVMTLEMLKFEVAECMDAREELMKVGRKIVDFHGEMILLQNYSALNCIGLMKILKKYDKRSDTPILIPFIQKVLDEPFCRTEVIKDLVKECELMIYHLFAQREQILPPEDHVSEIDTPRLIIPQEMEEIECMENIYLRLTIAALRTLKKIRSGSSTVSMFTMPPMPESNLY